MLSEDPLQQIRSIVDALSALIEKENYAEANETADKLDIALRGLSKEDLVALGEEERTYLYEVAQWLTDEDSQLKERSKVLVDIISPFNKKSALKSTKHY
ncbi:hypothetical protein D210916BOD24_23020 [Alteromonas sp. D210916BOD_24]|uniref:hypothetical protein n=1 Tax=Alteromonas sp. D210916BOD_24 TaxID=3157618 RepID=UPI00399CE1E0